MGTKSAEKSVHGFDTVFLYAANKGTVLRQCFEMHKETFGAGHRELFMQIPRSSFLPCLALQRF